MVRRDKIIVTTTMENTARTWNIRSPNWLVLLGILWFALGIGIFISGFSSTATIDINWETESEFDTAGFNIYRSESPEGDFIQINPQLIPSQADPASGASYTFTDVNVEPGKTYYYVLEDVEFDNTRERHDIILGQVRQVNWVETVIAAISFMFGFWLLASGIKEIRRR